jgi:hypothetical protein
MVRSSISKAFHWLFRRDWGRVSETFRGFIYLNFLLKGNGPAFAIWVGAGTGNVDTGGYIWGKRRETRIARMLGAWI